MVGRFVRRTLVPLAALALLRFATYYRADLTLAELTSGAPPISYSIGK